MTMPSNTAGELNAEVRTEWEMFRQEILKRIHELDGRTVANPSHPYHEPEWWLAMQAVASAARRAGGYK